jgi:hypothetical protein
MRTASILFTLALACTVDPGTDSASDTGGSTGGDTGGPMGDPAILVGTFQIELVPPVPAMGDTPETPGKTAVLGKVYDGPTPAQIIWEEASADGDCRLLTPRVPFCSTPCGGSAVCVEDETCEPYPTSGSVGTVTVTGVATDTGAAEFTMEPINNNYQAAGVKLAYPAFAEGDDLGLSAAGGDFQSFTVAARGIAPIDLTTTEFTLTADQPLALAWAPAGQLDLSTIHVKLDISHHGGTKGMIECATADDGALDIPAALISELLDLGVAGFPSIVMRRENTGATTIAAGRVDLAITTRVERFVDIPGLSSCTHDSQCPDGQTCQSDLTCA